MKDIKYEKSTGNVFEDLELSDPEKRLEIAEKTTSYEEYIENLKKFNDDDKI